MFVSKRNVNDTEPVISVIGENRIVDAVTVRELSWNESYKTATNKLVILPKPGECLDDVKTSNVMTEDH